MNKKLLPFTLFASIFSMALYGASEQAAAAYKVDCAKGNMKACYYTGIDYEVKGDVLNAKEYYEKSCKGGEGYGCYFLGSLYTRGAGAPQDIRKGANFYKQACDMGNASGCVVYGGLHANPNSKINQNLTTAKTYYEKACSLEPYKCDRLGAMYAKGLGVERNLDKSKEYYAKACDGGNAPACEAFNHSDAYNFALAYIQGDGVKQDPKKGVQELAKICDSDDIEAVRACVSAGDVYASPKSQIGQDFAAAKIFYEKACMRDDSKCAKLADMYAKAQGVALDFAKAKELYGKSCESGNNSACMGYKAVELYSNLNIRTATCNDMPKLGAACNLENIEACNTLGEMLSAGKCRQDLKSALAWYGKSCDLLDAKGCREYARINEFLIQLEALRNGGGDEMNQTRPNLENGLEISGWIDFESL